MANNNESFQNRQRVEGRFALGGIGAGLLFNVLSLPGMAGFAYTIGAGAALVYVGDRLLSGGKSK